MDRKQKALRWIDKAGRGVEIGPCHQPVAPKAEGYHVDIIDHANRQQLMDKYRGHNVDFNKIEEVDFVWEGQSFAELTGKRNYYDWVIASHVVEHTPDLIGFLNECDSILKEDGMLSLIVPDKRYCFDCYRPITGLARIIDSHIQRNKLHTAGTAAEFALNLTTQDGEFAWRARYRRGKMNLHNTCADAKNLMALALHDKSYHDFHAWCFTPHSFRLIIQDLFSLGLIELKEVGCLPRSEAEFYVTLGRSGKGSELSRLEMLNLVDRELSEATRRTSKFISSGRRLLGRGLRWAKQRFC